MQYALSLFPLLLFFLLFIFIIVCMACSALKSEDIRSGVGRPSYREAARGWGTPVKMAPPKRTWRPSKIQARVLVCPSCGKWNTPESANCWNCQGILPPSDEAQTLTLEAARTCSVCSYWIYPGERVSLCPYCQAQGHRAHMMEYVKAKGSCPACNRHLPLSLLIHTLPLIEAITPDSPSITIGELLTQGVVRKRGQQDGTPTE